MSGRFKSVRLFIFACIFSALAACTFIRPPAPYMPSRESIVPGETVTVKRNQNVYGVARQYNVSMRELIVLNDLQPPFSLHAGQRITLPAGGSDAGFEGASEGGGYAPSPYAAPRGAIDQSSLPPIQPEPDGRVTQYVDTPKAGTLGLAPVTAAPSAEVLTTPSPAWPMATTAASSISGQQQQVASITPPPPESMPEKALTMAWPVQGPILSSFGPKGQGLNNDGINIGAPKGAPVVAAAGGIVVYAGNEMKGFGNLILIRHAGGWVTAYAHLDRMLVTKDTVVAQGDEIGTVGKTGNVASPQLHFETRYQGKPVDPSGVIKG